MLPERIVVNTLPIRLGQFLKLVDIVQDGVEAKIRIAQGEIEVNGICEKRRGRRLREGDVVEPTAGEGNGRRFQIIAGT